MPSKYTFETFLQLYYDEGLTTLEIQRRLNLRPATLSKWLIRCGIDARNESVDRYAVAARARQEEQKDLEAIREQRDKEIAEARRVERERLHERELAAKTAQIRARQEAKQRKDDALRAELEYLISCYTYQEIADQRGVSRQRIQQMCQALGIYSPRGPKVKRDATDGRRL